MNEGEYEIADSMFTSSELTKYGTIRLRLRKTRLKFTSFNVAGKDVKLAEWTYYDTVTLSQAARRDLVVIATRDWYEFEAHDWPDAREGDGWVPMSGWRREELRQAQAVAEASVVLRAASVGAGEPEPTPAPTVAGDVASMNGVLASAGTKPVNGEVATHLLKHLERAPKHAVAVVDGLVALGWAGLRLREPHKFKHLEEHNKNGAQRKTCRFRHS